MSSPTHSATPAPLRETGDSHEDSRQVALTQWVAQQLPPQTESLHLRSLGSDAGFRRYFRFNHCDPLLAVDAPPATEDSAQFIAIARYIAAQGVRSPRILAADTQQGFLLVEDFGDQLLGRVVNNENADSLYQQAIQELLRLHQSPDDPALIPRYDRALLRRELELFTEWFVDRLLGHSLTTEERSLLDNCFQQLEDEALSQPQTFVHRDYHSRNLILCADGKLGVIDFQGALWGGITYDLASLLRDCYQRWPAQQVTRWALDYRTKAVAAGLLSPSINETVFLRWFDWLGLQRHIKVLGIFARLHLRDGKGAYLHDLPLVIRYTLEVAQQYPALRPFADWFHRVLLPLAASQAWYKDYRVAGDPA